MFLVYQMENLFYVSETTGHFISGISGTYKSLLEALVILVMYGAEFEIKSNFISSGRMEN